MLPVPVSPPSFKCSAQNFPLDLISSPSYDESVSTIFASSPISFTFFWLPSLVRAKVPSDARTSRVGICPLPLTQVLYELPWLCQESLSVFTVTTQFTLGGRPLLFRKTRLLSCHVMQCVLNAVSVSSAPPSPQSRAVGDTLCTLLQSNIIHFRERYLLLLYKT